MKLNEDPVFVIKQKRSLEHAIHPLIEEKYAQPLN
jgi:hypothetical protein